MKQALVFSALGRDTGCALRARYLAKGLEENGWSVRLLIPPFRSLPWSLEAFLSLPYFCWVALSRPVHLAVGIKPYPNCWLALWLAQGRGARAVADVDDLDAAYRGGLLGLAVRACQAAAFWLLRAFSTHHPAIRASRPGLRWLELGQGVDTGIFKAGSGKAVKGLLVYTAHLNVAAQIDTLMSWLQPLLREPSALRLVVAGGGPMLARYRERYAGPKVSFTGALSPEAVAGWIGKASVCLSAYAPTQGNESRVPMKIGEYLAMGKPVLSNFIPGMKPLKPYVYLCRPGQKDFCSTLKRLAGGGGDGREARGAAWIRRHGSSKAVAARFLRDLG